MRVTECSVCNHLHCICFLQHMLAIHASRSTCDNASSCIFEVAVLLRHSKSPMEIALLDNQKAMAQILCCLKHVERQ